MDQCGVLKQRLAEIGSEQFAAAKAHPLSGKVVQLSGGKIAVFQENIDQREVVHPAVGEGAAAKDAVFQLEIAALKILQRFILIEHPTDFLLVLLLGAD